MASTEPRITSSSKRSTCPPLRPMMRSTTLPIRASPPGSKKRVITRRISLARVTGRRSTLRGPWSHLQVAYIETFNTTSSVKSIADTPSTSKSWAVANARQVSAPP